MHLKQIGPGILDEATSQDRAHLSPNVVFYLACAFIGLGGGAAAIALKQAVGSLEAILRGAVQSRDLNYLILILPPLGLALSVLFARYVVKADLSHGVTKVLSAISRDGGRVPTKMIWAPLIGCTISVGFGASLAWKPR